MWWGWGWEKQEWDGFWSLLQFEFSVLAVLLGKVFKRPQWFFWQNYWEPLPTLRNSYSETQRLDMSEPPTFFFKVPCLKNSHGAVFLCREDHWYFHSDPEEKVSMLFCTQVLVIPLYLFHSRGTWWSPWEKEISLFLCSVLLCLIFVFLSGN